MTTFSNYVESCNPYMIIVKRTVHIVMVKVGVTLALFDVFALFMDKVEEDVAQVNRPLLEGQAHVVLRLYPILFIFLLTSLSRKTRLSRCSLHDHQRITKEVSQREREKEEKKESVCLSVKSSLFGNSSFPEAEAASALLLIPRWK